MNDNQKVVWGKKTLQAGPEAIARINIRRAYMEMKLAFWKILDMLESK